MPGAIWAIPGCYTSWATPGVSLLEMPKSNEEYSVNWRKNISWHDHWDTGGWC